MFEYRFIRNMTPKEESLIETAIFNINMKPHEAFTVYCDTLDPRCLPFIVTLIKRVKEGCRDISGCTILKDKIVFGKDSKK